MDAENSSRLSLKWFIFPSLFVFFLWAIPTSQADKDDVYHIESYLELYATHAQGEECQQIIEAIRQVRLNDRWESGSHTEWINYPDGSATHVQYTAVQDEAGNELVERLIERYNSKNERVAYHWSDSEGKVDSSGDWEEILFKECREEVAESDDVMEPLPYISPPEESWHAKRDSPNSVESMVGRPIRWRGHLSYHQQCQDDDDPFHFTFSVSSKIDFELEDMGIQAMGPDWKPVDDIIEAQVKSTPGLFDDLSPEDWDPATLLIRSFVVREGSIAYQVSGKGYVVGDGRTWKFIGSGSDSLSTNAIGLTFLNGLKDGSYDILVVAPVSYIVKKTDSEGRPLPDEESIDGFSFNYPGQWTPRARRITDGKSWMISPDREQTDEEGIVDHAGGYANTCSVQAQWSLAAVE